MALQLFDESFVHRYAHESNALMFHRSNPLNRSSSSERPGKSCRGYFHPIGRGMVGFLLFFVMLAGGLPVASLAQAQVQQDVSQPMQELQDQWREIMKKEYNPSANQVILPATRPAPAPTSQLSPTDGSSEAGRAGGLEASGNSPQPAPKVSESSPAKTRRSSVGRTKSNRKRTTGRAGRSTAKTSRKSQASSTASKAKTKKSSTRGKTRAVPAKAVQTGKPAPAKVTGTSRKSGTEKAAAAKAAGSSQKKKVAAKVVTKGQGGKKSGR